MFKHHKSCQIKSLPQIYEKAFGFITTGKFVEVGAFNCVNWSNTRCLTEAGWTGIVIEPNPVFAIDCYNVPGVAVEECAIGKENGKTKLYLGGSNSTIKPKMVELYNSTDWAKFSGLSDDRWIEVELFTLDTILEKHDWPTEFEVLSIDVEGAEIDVLKGFTIDYWQPRIVIVETHEENEDKRLARKARWINLYFQKHFYKKIYSDTINSVYENNFR